MGVWQPHGEPRDLSPGTGVGGREQRVRRIDTVANRFIKSQLLRMRGTHLVFRFKALVPLVVHLLHVVSETDG